MMLLRRWCLRICLNHSLLLFNLKSGRLFQILGREKSVSFFTWSERARGTLNSLQLRRFGPSFLWLFKVQALCNDGGDCLMFMIDGVDEEALCVAD